jgi:NADP-dependent 3-hydroxy acid dehydrogenase YdfG
MTLADRSASVAQTQWACTSKSSATLQAAPRIVPPRLIRPAIRGLTEVFTRISTMIEWPSVERNSEGRVTTAIRMVLKSKQPFVAVITGASSGIGEAVAVALGAQGACMALTARRQNLLDEVARRVDALGGSALVIPGDLRDEVHVKKIFSATESRWGRLDALINSAGYGVHASLHEGNSEQWRMMWEVNVHALAVATREALAHFDPIRGGHVINIGSTSGHRVPTGASFYAATKYAVRALTEILRQELVERNSPTRVSSISPGRVATTFFANDNSQLDGNDALLHSQLRPEDVAQVVLQIVNAPRHVAIHDVIMRARGQTL